MNNSSHPQTIAECVIQFSELSEVSDSARLDTEVILAWVLKKNRTYLFTWPEKPLTEAQLHQFNHAFLLRKQGHPVAHIIGEREFWSLPFYTNNTTLIPRPDTEVLVESVLALIASHYPNKQRVSLLDLGTGTGAIAIALAKECPWIKVDAVDFSHDAVELAIKNAQRNHVSNIKVYQSDWFSKVTGRFDIIVSNPPYIDQNDEHLKQGDVRFEPLSALVAEDDGLKDINHIAGAAKDYLNKNGWLIVEHGWQQKGQVQSIFNSVGMGHLNTIKDFGGQDRVTLGKYSV